MPVSNRKRYLTGPDWVIGTLDHAMKATTCAGNMSQIVLRFKSRVDEHMLRERVVDCVRQFPVLAGSVRRDLLLAPYWKIPRKARRDVTFEVQSTEELRDDAALTALLEASANTRFRDDNDHLAFRLFSDRGNSSLAMAFDHRVFDARGAELFLDLIQRSMLDGRMPGDLSFASTRALSQWTRKFLAGRNVNRRIIALSKSLPEALPIPAGMDRRFRYHRLSFDEQRTAAIYKRAYAEAGYLMESPYLLAVIIQCMHALFAARQSAGTGYLIPVTMDLRPGKDTLQEIFFNYVSYLFYQVPVQAVSDRAALIALLKQQMYDQVKSCFPRDLAEASLLTRIAPLPLLGKLLTLPTKGKMASFAFSHLGRSSYRHAGFMGTEVVDLFHMPRVPVPPGLGFFSNDFNNRLSLVISYLDGLLGDEEVNMLDTEIRTRLGVEKAA